MFPTVINSLSVGVFSFSLICKRIAVSILCSEKTARKLLWRKVLFHRGQRKVRLSEGRPPLVTFHFFCRDNKHIFRAYPFTLKIAELSFETPAGLTFYNKLKHLARLSPPRGAEIGFVGVLPLPLICDLPENTALHTETTHKTALELLDTAFSTRFEAK